MENQEQKNDSWLERLAIESWQAELIISGIAIFGSFQLFGSIRWLVDFLHFNVPEAFSIMAYFLCTYLLFAVSLLCISLIMHFGIRALWIASIGLESVFPEGIKKENDTFSPGLMQLILSKYPSLHEFNVSLDRLASSFLGYAFSMVMMNTGIVVLISVALILGIILSQFISDELASNVIISAIGLIFTGVAIPGMLMSKATENKPKVQRLFFRLNSFFGLFFSNIFYRPQYYFMYIFRTNLQNSLYYKLTIGSMLLSVIAVMGQFNQSNLLVLMEHNYFKYDTRIDKIYSDNYEDETNIDKQTAYIRPLIPSQIIHDLDDFWLFLPTPERESRIIMSVCSVAETPKTGDREVDKKAQRKRQLACYQEQILISIDDLTPTYTAKFYIHPHQNEPGLFYYFPNIIIPEGEHTLTIVHQAVQQEGPKTDRVPFIYSAKGL